MNLRTILNRRRFVGCVNPRAVVRESRLSLFCEETEDGVCLMSEWDNSVVPLMELPMPEYLRERVHFWNAWCSSGFNGESEVAPSVFGLEAYAVSIGVELLRLFPECAVDWCGLALHDDVALMNAMREDLSLPCPPVDVTLNRYAALLMRGDSPAVLPKDCLVARRNYDWGGLEDLYLVGNETREAIWVEGGLYPPWLEQAHGDIAETEVRAAYWRWNIPVEEWWKVSPLLHPLQTAALAVDWARTLYPLHPVSMNELYVTGPDVLRLCRPESMEGRRSSHLPRRPRRMLVTRGGKGFIE